MQVLERVCSKDMAASSLSWIHTKSLYKLSPDSQALLKGVTKEMCCTSEWPNGMSLLREQDTSGIASSGL